MDVGALQTPSGGTPHPLTVPGPHPWSCTFPDLHTGSLSSLGPRRRRPTETGPWGEALGRGWGPAGRPGRHPQGALRAAHARRLRTFATRDRVLPQCFS